MTEVTGCFYFLLGRTATTQLLPSHSTTQKNNNNTAKNRRALDQVGGSVSDIKEFQMKEIRRINKTHRARAGRDRDSKWKQRANNQAQGRTQPGVGHGTVRQQQPYSWGHCELAGAWPGHSSPAHSWLTLSTGSLGCPEATLAAAGC